jgi:hypothetical protein
MARRMSPPGQREGLSLHMKIDWDHYEETDTESEFYRTTFEGVVLTVYVLGDEDNFEYEWSTNETGTRWGHGLHSSAEGAMIEAMTYVKVSREN